MTDTETYKYFGFRQNTKPDPSQITKELLRMYRKQSLEPA